ncbi:MAG: alpha/beta hydrolase [Chloroflexota bacterium]
MADLYHIAAHPRERTDEPFPCLVLLHGRGSHEQDLFGLVPELPKQFLVVSVRAPLTLDWGGYQWYEFDQTGVPDAKMLAEASGRLRDLVTSLPGRFPVDPARVTLLGFSQGALMAGYLALTEPALISAAVMLSGYLPAEMEADAALVKGKPFFMAHGTEDPVLPVLLARQARLCLENFGVDLEYHEYPMPHAVIPQELGDLNAWWEKRDRKSALL